MDSDNILLITFMIRNCFRERTATSEAELKDGLVLHKAWEGWLLLWTFVNGLAEPRKPAMEAKLRTPGSMAHMGHEQQSSCGSST